MIQRNWLRAIFSRYFFLWSLVLLFHCSFGQQKYLKFQYLTADEGLSQSNVICSFQDSRGFMWFGTRDGLNKYDGYSIQVFKNDINNPNSISDNTINDIVEDSNGNLWIATSQGISKFDRRREIFTQILNDPNDSTTIAEDVVTCLLIDRKGVLWVGYDSHGLDRYERESGRFVHYQNDYADSTSLSDNAVKDIIQDIDGNIWIGTFDGGLNRYDYQSDAFVQYRHDSDDPNSISHNSIWSLFEDSHHRIWIGTMGGGLNWFDRENNRFKRFNNHSQKAPIHDYVFSISEDLEGNIWVGTINEGIYILNANLNRTAHHKKDVSITGGLNDNSIWSIYKDRKGNMWVGTLSHGINFFSRDSRKFRHYMETDDSQGLNSGNIRSIYEDSDYNLWIGTDGGGVNLFNRDNNTFTHLTHKEGDANSISGNYVLTIIEDRQKNLWIGTWGSGITVYNRKKNSYKHFNHKPSDTTSLGAENASVIFEDSDGVIWVGAYTAGLDRFDPQTETFIHYRSNPDNLYAITDNMVNCIFEDSKKRIWIGTNGGGLSHFDKSTGKFRNFVHRKDQNSISGNFIYCIQEDYEGNLWIGTNTGLNIFTPEKEIFKTYYVEHGLPNNNIFAILEDDDHNLWLSTNNGISKFNPKTQEFRNYSKADGVQAKEFKQAACKDHLGRMYFGGINGFNEFHPDSIIDVPYDPPLVFTSFQIFNKPVPVSQPGMEGPLKMSITDVEEIVLSYDQSVISFEFATLNFTDPERKHYKYILEGFDKEWNYIGTNRRVTYTNLNPGGYTLRVKGSNNSGEWSDSEISVRLIVTPPFWKTIWFRLLAASIFTFSIIGVYRIRVGLINNQKEALERQVAERTERLAISSMEERKAREEAEKARLEAEQANRAKSIFLATMSHEIRTPMNGVIGMASLLHETSLTKEQQEYTSSIQSSGEALLAVINDILDFSKIESGKMELEFKDFDLRKCIEDVFDVFAGRVTGSSLDLIYQIDNNVPSQIIGDYFRLRQVLINLVGNAVKFTTEGEIFLRVSMVQTEGDMVELSFMVRDTGIGIPEQKLKGLFRAFEQVDSSTTRKYGGTGLGLAISEKLVKLMGGGIQVHSEVGKGTTFTFTISANMGVKSIKNYPTTAMKDLEGKRILVIDDNATNRNILKIQLEQWKFAPMVAHSAQEALKILDTPTHFDLVLTDMHMPKMNGIELAEEIRKKRAEIPIVLLSSVGDEYSKKDLSLFSSILAKPIKQSHLFSNIVNTIKKQKSVTEAVIPEGKPKIFRDLSGEIPMEVLIVDDNPINQMLSSRIFHKLGYRPHTVSNGVESLSAIEERTYNIIMMDVQMPEMDGLEATRRIRDKSIPQPIIIAMTANAMQQDREDCLKAGMNDYISKPIKLEELVVMIEKWAAKINAR